MNRDASVCPQCNSVSEPWIQHAGHWWFRSSSGKWQWYDEKANIWRWYEDGTPTSQTATDRTPSVEVDPAVTAPPGETLRQSVADREAPGPSAELERLADLHARGVLSDEEFQQAKKQVLAGGQ
jgi:hypothetical protein